MEQEVQAMLQLGMTEPPTSEWHSFIILVPKPDGLCRFCIDFRQVNTISNFNTYPMPRGMSCSTNSGRTNDPQPHERVLADPPVSEV